MIPQAGVAIGLIFVLAHDEILMPYAEVITPIVLTGVFVSELIGPISARFAITRAGEMHFEQQPGFPNERIETTNKNGAIACSLMKHFV